MALATSVASRVAVAAEGGYSGAFQDVKYVGAKGSRSLQAYRYPSSSCSQGQEKGQWSNEKLCTRRRLRGFYASPLKERLDGPVCVIRDLNGASREDSESVSNKHFSTKTEIPRKKNASVLKNIIQEIEPLDISLISRDVSPDSTDAMKRTISGMLGLLPSDQFQVIIESSKEPLARLLVSSMMTGYTLQNGEYRLCLKRSLENTDPSEDRSERDLVEEHMLEMVSGIGVDMETLLVEGENLTIKIPSHTHEKTERAQQVVLPDELGAVSPEVANYIQQLQAKLATTSKELAECKHALTTLEMESMAGEETNDLLDYLRSLEPEKVAELSKPTSPEVENVINEVIDGLLANLSLDQAPPVPSFRDGMSAIGSAWEENNSSELLDNVPLHFQSNVTTSRDYLARLLFWCMLLGHYMRAAEYRLELSRTLNLSGKVVLGTERSRQT